MKYYSFIYVHFVKLHELYSTRAHSIDLRAAALAGPNIYVT